MYTDRPDTTAILRRQLKKVVRGESDEEERTRLRKVLQAIEQPIVLTQDAYIGRGDTVADVRLGSATDSGVEAADELLLPPERAPPMPLLPLQREPSRDSIFVAVGRRKTSSATAMLVPVLAEEHATVLVNNKELPDYFPSYRSRDLVLDPLLLTERLGQFKAIIRVSGGGFMCMAPLFTTLRLSLSPPLVVCFLRRLLLTVVDVVCSSSRCHAARHRTSVGEV